jgi:hypothetical protein
VDVVKTCDVGIARNASCDCVTQTSRATSGPPGVPSYSSFGQVTSESHFHSGAVNVSTTPKVQYTYADGSSNTIRPTGLTYPNGRAVTYSYGTAGTLGDLTSRVTELNEGASTRVEYGYLGLSGVVTTRYPEPGVTYTLVGTAGGVDSDTGDIYHGLDRFGQVNDAYWHKAGGPDAALKEKKGEGGKEKGTGPFNRRCSICEGRRVGDLRHENGPVPFYPPEGVE